ncbi:MAG TPA: recombinase family protein, partial [Planctomycetota bacterium]|nr:recombinase family protein [Planctomycetota bacterium]
VGRSDGETFVLVPGDSEEAGVVQEIFRDFLDGHSPRSIALGLNRRGVISPRGKTWGRSTIIRVLRNPSYKGTLAWNRQTCARFHAASPDGQIARISNPAGRYKENPESKWVAVDGVWDGLVPAAEWKEANARLKGTRASACRGKGAASAFLASGLLRCTCGFHFAGCSFNDKDRPGQRYEYYRCLGNSERRMVTCTAKRIRRPVVDDYLERRIRELYFEPAAKKAVWKDVQEQLDAVLAAASAKDPCRKDRERLEEVGRRIGRLVEAVAGGALVLEDVKQQMASLKAEQAEIQARLARNKAAPRTGDIRSLRDKVLVACREQLERESDLWPDATPEQRKQIVRAHVAGMTADYAKSRITTEFYPLVTAGEIGIQATTC